MAEEDQAQPPVRMPERLLRLPEVSSQVGLSQTEIYRRLNAHDFPVPIKVTGRRVAWLESEIQEWISKRPRQVANAAGRPMRSPAGSDPKGSPKRP
jgi:prophage regulatory protein